MLKTLSATAIGLVMFAAPSFGHDQAEAQKAVDTFSETMRRRSTPRMQLAS